MLYQNRQALSTKRNKIIFVKQKKITCFQMEKQFDFVLSEDPFKL